MSKAVIGVDQSYTRTGISVAVDGQLKLVTSVNFKGARSKSEKRKMLQGIIARLLVKALRNASETIIIVERVRQFSAGKKGKSFTSINYIKAVGALIGAIVDTASEFEVEVYSVDTRSWKSKVVGTSKSKKGEDKKLATVRFVESLGHSVTSTNKNDSIVHDDDASDSACIALYGFVAGQKLKKEE